MSSRAASFSAALALACFIALALGDIWQTSPTHDETTHLASGWSYLETGDFRLNIEHPPLVKVLAALPLRFMHVRAGAGVADAWAEATKDDRAQWTYAHRLLFGVRDGVIDQIPTSQQVAPAAFLNDVTAMFRASRLTLLLVIGIALGATIFAWSRELFGASGAVLPVALFAFDPSFIAHTALVTTDAAAALLISASVYLFWRCSRSSGRANVVAFATVVALAHLAKFSAVILWPVFVLLAALSGREHIRRLMVCIAAALAATAIVIAPLPWIAGFHKTMFDVLGRTAYLRGAYAPGFRNYFVWAMFLKTPVITLLLVSAAVVYCIRRWRPDLLFLFVPAVVYFVAASASTLNIGHRHILPVYPFLFVACGALPRKWMLALPLVILSAVLSWGNHLAYFNEIAGGTANGHRFLIDSNLDWGQDLQRLGTWVREHHVSEPILLSYFGTAEPRYYGIAFNNAKESLRPSSPIFAISINEYVRGLGYHDAYRDFLQRNHAELIGTAGSTIRIYRISFIRD